MFCVIAASYHSNVWLCNSLHFFLCGHEKRGKLWQLYPPEKPGEPNTLQNISGKIKVRFVSFRFACVRFAVCYGQTMYGCIAAFFFFYLLCSEPSVPTTQYITHG